MISESCIRHFRRQNGRSCSSGSCTHQERKGIRPAEENPSRFHGIVPFDIETGEAKEKSSKDSYTDIFSKVFCDIAKQNDAVVGITAAMADGTGLARFARMFPDRFFDVGIAEEHALTFAAGLAAGGLKPVVAVYSSFLQRAFVPGDS